MVSSRIAKEYEIVNKLERVVRYFFRNPNGTYRRFWDLDYRNRDYFYSVCKEYKISPISAFALLSEQTNKNGLEERKEY